MTKPIIDIGTVSDDPYLYVKAGKEFWYVNDYSIYTNKISFIRVDDPDELKIMPISKVKDNAVLSLYGYIKYGAKIHDVREYEKRLFSVCSIFHIMSKFSSVPYISSNSGGMITLTDGGLSYLFNIESTGYHLVKRCRSLVRRYPLKYIAFTHSKISVRLKDIIPNLLEQAGKFYDPLAVHNDTITFTKLISKDAYKD